MQKKNPRPLLIPYTTINSKWIKDLNVRLKTIKLVEENMGSKIPDISLSNIFLIYLLRQGKNKQKQMVLIKLKRFCTAKETINKTKRKLTEWEKIFANNKGLIIKIYEEFI